MFFIDIFISIYGLQDKFMIFMNFCKKAKNSLYFKNAKITFYIVNY